MDANSLPADQLLSTPKDWDGFSPLCSGSGEIIKNEDGRSQILWSYSAVDNFIHSSGNLNFNEDHENSDISISLGIGLSVAGKNVNIQSGGSAARFHKGEGYNRSYFIYSATTSVGFEHELESISPSDGRELRFVMHLSSKGLQSFSYPYQDTVEGRKFCTYRSFVSGGPGLPDHGPVAFGDGERDNPRIRWPSAIQTFNLIPYNVPSFVFYSKTIRLTIKE